MTRPPGPARPKARATASILTKLIAVTAIVVAVIVGGLAVYFPARELADLRQEQLARARTYGTLLAGQLRTAVAFADRETAREVLSALAVDPEVVAITLFVDPGEPLFRTGTPGGWVEQVRGGRAADQVFQFGSRVAVIARVESLEGPRGTLVIELSSARMQSFRAAVVVRALVVGGCALAFGTIAAYLIARSLVRRLRAILEVASTAQHDVAPRLIVVTSRDEIGVLGDAVNQMLARLHADGTRLHHTVAELTAAESQLAKANHELEKRVATRTAKLSELNHQLEDEMKHRSTVEIELRQAQKLESVGRLASGVAHEINTPVQFVSDSCAFLETATAEMFEVVTGYRDLLGALERGALKPAVAFTRARALDAEHDVDYLAEHIPVAIQRALLGLQRVAGIVRAMKEFAYPDRKNQTPSDLNRAITSTLTVARNEYKYVAELVTELAELPPVTCHVGELNQVILNIVINATHAIEAHRPDGSGKITIRTSSDGDQVKLTIEDNGGGIPADIIDKIFDPFFTTKEIGKGTGQGLAIARAVVVDKHRGKLEVASRVGEGTTFTITLPVHGVAEDAQLAATA